MLSVPDSDSWPCLQRHCQGVQAAEGPEGQEDSGAGEEFCRGLVPSAPALQSDNSSGLYPSPDGAVSTTRVGSSWVFGREAEHQEQQWDVAPRPP